MSLSLSRGVRLSLYICWCDVLRSIRPLLSPTIPWRPFLCVFFSIFAPPSCASALFRFVCVCLQFLKMRVNPCIFLTRFWQYVLPFSVGPFFYILFSCVRKWRVRERTRGEGYFRFVVCVRVYFEFLFIILLGPRYLSFPHPPKQNKEPRAAMSFFLYFTQSLSFILFSHSLCLSICELPWSLTVEAGFILMGFAL